LKMRVGRSAVARLQVLRVKPSFSRGITSLQGILTKDEAKAYGDAVRARIESETQDSVNAWVEAAQNRANVLDWYPYEQPHPEGKYLTQRNAADSQEINTAISNLGQNPSAAQVFAIFVANKYGVTQNHVQFLLDQYFAAKDFQGAKNLFNLLQDDFHIVPSLENYASYLSIAAEFSTAAETKAILRSMWENVGHYPLLEHYNSLLYALSKVPDPAGIRVIAQHMRDHYVTPDGQSYLYFARALAAKNDYSELQRLIAVIDGGYPDVLPEIKSIYETLRKTVLV